MMIALIVLVCLLLLALFFAVTIAGGRAHDRQNAQRAEAERRRMRKGEAQDDRDQGPEPQFFSNESNGKIETPYGERR